MATTINLDPAAARHAVTKAQRFRERMKRNGFRLLQAWVHEDDHAKWREAVERSRKHRIRSLKYRKLWRD